MIRIEAYDQTEEFDYYDDLIDLIVKYGQLVDITKDERDRDLIYRQLVKSVDEAEEFYYYLDPWEDTEQYEREVVEFMRDFEDLVGRGLIDEKGDAYEIEGLLIDRRYSSLDQCAVLLKKL